jgi:succinoglycan biosynthesis protein ExoU
MAKDVSTVACVDVLIAARNRADTIERAVFSALAQGEVRTVIVVDDGSTDDTAALVRQCDPTAKRVIVERLAASLGPAAARNIAIEISTAPWLTILDADDYFVTGRIGALLAWSDDCDLVADDLVHVKQDGNDCAPTPSITNVELPKPRLLTLEEFVLGNLTRWGQHRRELGYLKPLICRRFLHLHGLQYDERLHFGEDYMLYARALAARARFRFVPIAGYVAVERLGSISSRHNRRDLEVLQNGVRELMSINRLTPRELAAFEKHHADLQRRAQWFAVVEALQSHDFRRFLSTFFRSAALTSYLTGRLLAEVPRQIRKHFGSLRRR